jgi:hypothetical protein
MGRSTACYISEGRQFRDMARPECGVCGTKCPTCFSSLYLSMVEAEPDRAGPEEGEGCWWEVEGGPASPAYPHPDVGPDAAGSSDAMVTGSEVQGAAPEWARRMCGRLHRQEGA